jgi:hypothetical protein
MTATGDFPAPGPQDREPPPAWAPAGPPPAGPPPAGYPVVGPPSYPRQALLPQMPMYTHKPGIVALRPLQLGDILDGAVKAIRFNPKSMVGLSAIVLAVFLVPSVALGMGASHLVGTSLSRLGPGFETLATYPALIVQAICTTFATAILSGLLIHVVGQAVLGRKADIGETWRATRGRVWSLIALVLVSALFSLLSMALLIGPGVLLLVNHKVGAGLSLLFLGMLGLVVVSVWFSTKISLAAPAIVLEGHSVSAGLRRSFALTRGAFWRILGITLLAGLIAGLVGGLLGLPFSAVGTAVAVMSGQGSESAVMIQSFVSNLSALLTGAITTPFVAAVTGLLYIDRRMRLEALDVILIRESQTNPAPPL